MVIIRYTWYEPKSQTETHRGIGGGHRPDYKLQPDNSKSLPRGRVCQKSRIIYLMKEERAHRDRPLHGECACASKGEQYLHRSYGRNPCSTHRAHTYPIEEPVATFPHWWDKNVIACFLVVAEVHLLRLGLTLMPP